MEICLVVFGFALIVMSSLIVFLGSTLKKVQENQLTQCNHMSELIDIVKKLGDQVNELERSEIRRCKREFDARKKKREE